jgi:hypothetical protein
MKHFSNGQRVKVVSHDDLNMIGNVGTVVRLRIQDNGAWVKMDKGVTAGMRKEHFPFSGDATDSRCNHTLLYPEHCEAA